MPPIERFTRHFNREIFKERLKEDKRLEDLEAVTINEAEIEDIQTDDSEDEEDVMDEILRVIEIDGNSETIENDLNEMEYT